MRNRAYAVGLAVLGNAGQACEAHETESEENGPKNDKHVVSDPVDDRLEPGGVLLEPDERASEQKADEGRVDCITREDEPHADLRLESVVEEFGLHRELHLVLDFEQLLENQGVCKHDEQTCKADDLQREII